MSLASLFPGRLVIVGRSLFVDLCIFKVRSIICGGFGGVTDFYGTYAVHTHMTNSRFTHREVLKWGFPVLLESFRIRRIVEDVANIIG